MDKPGANEIASNSKSRRELRDGFLELLTRGFYGGSQRDLSKPIKNNAHRIIAHVSRKCAPRSDVSPVRANRRLSFESHAGISLHRRYAPGSWCPRSPARLVIDSLSIPLSVISLRFGHLHPECLAFSANTEVVASSRFLWGCFLIANISRDGCPIQLSKLLSEFSSLEHTRAREADETSTSPRRTSDLCPPFARVSAREKIHRAFRPAVCRNSRVFSKCINRSPARERRGPRAPCLRFAIITCAL